MIPTDTFSDFLINAMTLLLMFFLFGASVWLEAKLRYEKLFLVKWKLKKIYRRYKITDLEALHNEAEAS